MRWTGDTQFIDAERAKVDLTVPSQDLSLVAEFTPIRLTIETSVVGSGTVSSGGTYDMGESVSLTATPSGIDATAPRGYQLEKWLWFSSTGDSFNSTDNPLEIYMDSNFTATAVFSPIPPDEVFIQLDSTPSGAGTLYDDPDARSWNVALDLIQRNLYATANPGYSFWVDIEPNPYLFSFLDEFRCCGFASI